MTADQEIVENEWTAGVHEGKKVMTRPLQATEQIFDSGEESWPVKFTISLNLRDSGFDQNLFTQRLRLAWQWLALEYPQTTATTSEGKFVTRLLDGSEEQEEWLQKTFNVVEGTNAEEYDVLSNIPNHAMLYYFPTSSQVTLVSPHVSIEATGALKMFNLLMDRAINHDSIEKNYQPRADHLPASLEQALDIHSANEQHQKLVGDALMECEKTQPSLADESQPASDNEIKEKGYRGHQVLTFTPEETSRIIEKSKQSGISVTSFVFAALLEFLTELETNEKSSYYTSFDIYNMRTVLPDTLANSPFAFYGAFWPTVIETPKGDAKTILKNVDSHLKEAAKHLRNDAHPSVDEASKALKPMALACQQIFQVLAQDPEGLRPSPNISSFGVCENYLNRSYGSVQITDFNVSTKSSSPQCPGFAYSFRNRLNFGTTYSRRFHSDAQMAERNQGIRNKMLQILDLDL
jgi:hypothetical protein